MRAWLEVLADKSLPSLVAGADVEVAAAFTGIFKILMANGVVVTKSRQSRHYQSTA
jgi:hypothetical protein